MSKKNKLTFITAIFVGFVFTAALFFQIGKNSVEVNEQTFSLAALLTSVPEKDDATAFSSPTEAPSSAVKALNTSITPVPTELERTTILTSTDDLSGYRTSNGQGNSNIDIQVGRNNEGVSRGFISFDLTLLPAGIFVKEAKLRLYQKEITGRPYSVGGALKIDHLNYGNTLDDSDYGMAALLSGFSIASTTPRIGWVEVEITDQIKDDIRNARPRSQYRLHFTIEQRGDSPEGDFAYFELLGQDSMAPFSPQLVVRY